jgi:hypothetical protein
MVFPLCLQWAAELLKASVLEDAAKLTEVLTASTTCLTGDCAAGAAKAFVAITANAVSLKVSAPCRQCASAPCRAP